MKQNNATCQDPSCCRPAQPGTAWGRRDFLKGLSLGAAALTLQPLMTMAGPFTRADFERLVPRDKKLSREWLDALTARGEPEVYQGEALRRIGMPIGGIGAGQVYLGGDGRLWHWDIFNDNIATGSSGPHYAQPMQPEYPFDQGFGLRLLDAPEAPLRKFQAGDWADIRFRGEYPVGVVNYGDPACPLAVRLQAYSPFIPLSTDESSLPVIVMEYELHNTSAKPVAAEVIGWLENAVCRRSGQRYEIQLVNRAGSREGLSFVESRAERLPRNPAANAREDIVFDDFERATYDPWEATGSAFGQGPVVESEIPGYQGALGAHGQRAVNTHSAPPATTVEGRDSHAGTLTSPEFRIERDYINFLIGGGSHQGKTCVNLLVEGRVVASVTGRDHNLMQPHSLRVSPWAGKTARLQLVDRETGPWGNIGIDHIVFSDSPVTPPGVLGEEPDFGTLCLGVMRGRSQAGSQPGEERQATRLPGTPLVGTVARKVQLKPGQKATVSFLLSWHFPNLRIARLGNHHGRWYGTQFAQALEVSAYAARNLPRLRRDTLLWRDTWYDSTLPYWFLDRTFLNTSILATSTCYRLGNNRFYGWEGVGCCAGTCTHVWQYAQAVARLFPDLERSLREKVDYDLAMQPDGRIFFRGEHNDHWAVDGQCGVILRTCREHQVSEDDTFLRRVWPATRRALLFLISRDARTNGILDGPQHNTLDADWWGEIAWLSGMYLAALRAGEEMARDHGDLEFAQRCRAIFDRGRQELVERLFDGEYFINRIDPAHLDAINSGTGCHIDQVFGQSWAAQLGLGRVLPPDQTRSALRALWTYNFTPDVGPYREKMKPGRWYALSGEAGLLMCTFPRTDWDYERAKGKGPEWAAGYFNECMNGFEYQAAWHMLAEGLVTEGLAVTRAVHDRYSGHRRNPWNEIECGDHYARSMASYGVYLSACGYEYHGPKGRLGFAPAFGKEDFRCAFTAAAGWGTFSQKKNGASWDITLEVKHGKLSLQTLVLGFPEFKKVNLSTGRGSVTVTPTVQDGRLQLELERRIELKPGAKLTVTVQ